LRWRRTNGMFGLHLMISKDFEARALTRTGLLSLTMGTIDGRHLWGRSRATFTEDAVPGRCRHAQQATEPDRRDFAALPGRVRSVAAQPSHCPGFRHGDGLLQIVGHIRAAFLVVYQPHH